MRLFRGLDGTDYQDILRALGFFCDERRLRNLRIIETDDGMIIQASPLVDGAQSDRFETYLLTDADLQHLLVRAYERRQAGQRALSTGRGTGLTGVLPSRRLPGAPAATETVPNGQ